MQVATFRTRRRTADPRPASRLPDPIPDREDVSWTVGGDAIAAWLYRPSPGAADTLRNADGAVPCVVLAHGFDGVREQRLDACAARFAARGLAALVFDYRCFGASEGAPRQLIGIRRQLADWRAAISYARTLPGVDSGRIALWGTSSSGGHVVKLAAEDPRVAAAVAQVPFADGLAELGSRRLLDTLRLMAAGVLDVLGELVGRPARLLSFAGPPRSLAVLTTDDALPSLEAITPPGSTWRNEVVARFTLAVGFYRPGRAAAHVRCPLLVCVADFDRLAPPPPALRMVRAAPDAELVRYPFDHFGIYLEGFERAAADQAEFLVRKLATP